MKPMRSRYHRLSLLVVLSLLLLSALGVHKLDARVGGPNDLEALLISYLKLSIAQQIPAQATLLAENLREDVTAQVKATSTKWMKKQAIAIRSALQDRFEDDAKNDFQEFVNAFTTAEKDENALYLAHLVDTLELDKLDPNTYSGLRANIVETHLQSEVMEGSKLLGEIQTWLDLKSRGTEVPPLDFWVARNEKAPSGRATSGGSASSKKKAPELDPLEAAEAEFGEVDFELDDFSSPLDSFDSSRKAKRERQLAEAQAGMQQVAAERQAAEEEYAQKKLAAAQADAEAMKRHAEDLAAVEQQALEQRQRSWGNRLKGIVGTAAGSFGGAFLGGVGSRAAEEAIDVVWPTQ